MRLWSIHPSYLDSKGLVALWRETLLAQNVLKGNTKGYKNHPQLERFKITPDPLQTISNYLHAIHDEATKRGYTFDKGKIARPSRSMTINVTTKQLLYELDHLRSKLIIRDPKKFAELLHIKKPKPHSLFAAITGAIESWERQVKIK